MTQKVVLFNGPPRSGKDTAARACFACEDLNNYYRVFERMSRPLKKGFAGVVGVPVNKFDHVEHFEDRKEERIDFIGVSFRQFQIDMSEKFMKPLYGQDVFGRLFVQRVMRQTNPRLNVVIFVPDCGFDIEYTTLSNAFDPENVLVVKLYRPGTDFKGDSRTYLKVGSFGDKRDTEHVIHVNNAGTQDEFERKIVTRVGKWLTKETS